MKNNYLTKEQLNIVDINLARKYTECQTAMHERFHAKTNTLMTSTKRTLDKLLGGMPVSDKLTLLHSILSMSLTKAGYVTSGLHGSVIVSFTDAGISLNEVSQIFIRSRSSWGNVVLSEIPKHELFLETAHFQPVTSKVSAKSIAISTVTGYSALLKSWRAVEGEKLLTKHLSDMKKELGVLLTRMKKEVKKK